MIPERLREPLDYDVVNRITQSEAMLWIEERVEGNFSRYPANEKDDPNPLNEFVKIVRSPLSTTTTREAVSTALLESLSRYILEHEDLVGTGDEQALRNSADRLYKLAISSGFVVNYAIRSTKDVVGHLLHNVVRKQSFSVRFGMASIPIASCFLSFRHPTQSVFWIDLAAHGTPFELIAMQGIGLTNVSGMISFILKAKEPKQLLDFLPPFIEVLKREYGRPLLHSLLTETFTATKRRGRLYRQVEKCFVDAGVLTLSNAPSGPMTGQYVPGTGASDASNTSELSVLISRYQRVTTLVANSKGIDRLHEAKRVAAQAIEDFEWQFNVLSGYNNVKALLETSPHRSETTQETVTYDMGEHLLQTLFCDLGFWLFCGDGFDLSASSQKCCMSVGSLRDKVSQYHSYGHVHVGGVAVPVPEIKAVIVDDPNSKQPPFNSHVIFWLDELFFRGEEDTLGENRPLNTASGPHRV